MNKQNLRDHQKWNVRTDLAYDEVINHQTDLPDLVQSDEKLYDIPIYKSVIGPNASKIINKKVGTYYTIDLENIDFHDLTICENIEKAVGNIIKRFIIQKKLSKGKCLLVGLGNINVTPDALGPYVMDNVIVTRHLFKMNSVSEGFSEVSAISPGVMGTTGIETFDIIKAVKEKIDVDYMIVVDALASNSTKRVNKTIQITDTGISPGSGVGNKRKELSEATVGIPVLAVGVPTVVDAVTITNDTINYVINYLLKEGTNSDNNAKELLMGQIGLLSEDEKHALMYDILSPTGYNLMVTPKEVDEDIEDLSKIIASGINFAVHYGVLEGKTE
ncbi:MAG: GPR endopeptidase [Bacilli bacterium]|nr:GPR endopeptidase [Bacilli bacterium]